MPADLRLVVALALIALLGISTLAITIAQPPQADNQLELPDLPDSELRTNTREQTPNPATQQRIRQALEGTGATPSGDGMLDDVLQFIERRGSVLDGSELESVESELGIANTPVDAPPGRAHAAESLLKAARRLEKIEPLDKTRRELVNQMRREAVRLLTQ
jgi:hypothetical protein